MGNDELMHFGVKGMKWGVRRKKKLTKAQKRARKQIKRNAKAREYEKKAKEAESDLKDLKSNGIKSKAFEKKYGYGAGNLSEWQFVSTFGKSRFQGLSDAINEKKMQVNKYSRLAQARKKGKLTGSEKRKLAVALVQGLVGAGLAAKTMKDLKGSEKSRMGKDFIENVEWTIKR